MSILATRENQLPPTVNFESARPGCDLDYVPNQTRPASIRAFLSNSAAFGGINVSVVGASSDVKPKVSERATEELWITGIGVVSPIGCGLEDFRNALQQGRSGIAPITSFKTDDCRSHHAALITELNTRKLAPTIDVRRTDPLNRFAMVAASLALKDSRLEVRAANSDRVGMVMTLNYGSIAVQERFQDSLMKDGIEKLSAKYFPSMVVSTVGGTVSQAFNLRGVNSTLVEGMSGGLHGLVHAAEILQNNTEQDAVVLIAADEVGSLFHRVFAKRGWLAESDVNSEAKLRAYQHDAKGWILGEGGVAFVIERASKAKARGATPLAKVSGYGLTSDANLAPAYETSSKWIEGAIQQALCRAGLQSSQIDLLYGNGRGEPHHDQRELQALQHIFGSFNTPIACVNGNLGVAGATSGLYALAAGMLSIKHGERYPLVGTAADMVNHLMPVTAYSQATHDHVLVTGSTENGNHAAVVLSGVR